MLYNFLVTYIAPPILTALGTALGLVILDTLLGILIALKTRTFKLSKLSDFMETSFVPYVGGLLLLAAFSGFPGMEATFFTVAAAIGVKFMADITSKINALFGDMGLVIQSPIKKAQAELVNPVILPVSPQATTSTNTPAADKTVPADSKDDNQTS